MELLFVDDDTELRESLAGYFRKKGHLVEEAGNAQEALAQLQGREFDAAVVDIVMPGMSGMELVNQLKSDGIQTEVVFLSGEGTIELAVAAMKLGACEFLTKPVRMGQLEAVLEKAVRSSAVRRENTQLRAILDRNTPKHRMVGNSPAMQKVFRLIERAAPNNKPIFIEGESGTGKELVARAIHQASDRSDKPMVVINCAALPEQLLESELFGYEKGAFTGAVTSKPGLFEVADGGTLFIDEIGELATSLQPKLLRVLEDGSLRRIGSLRERRVNVRIVAATNRNMAKEVEAKRFREDLFYRINLLMISLPPLRDRQGDVELLVEHFRGSLWEVEPEALDAMKKFNWPGNVRQLMNAIERTKIVADDHVIRKENLPPEVVQGASQPELLAINPDTDLATLTRAHVVQSLRRENGNKVRTAKLLGVSRRSLYRLIEKYHIESDEIKG